MIATGLERLLDDLDPLAGRRFGVLAHGASVSARLMPIHLELARRGFPPAVLFGPEHGYYGVEQDMVPSEDQRDPWTGVPIRSLYGHGEHTLRPAPEAFTDLDLLLIDLQDVGSRYYPYAATATRAAEVALAAGCEVWVLDRPNPLGGDHVLLDAVVAVLGAEERGRRSGGTLGERQVDRPAVAGDRSAMGQQAVAPPGDARRVGEETVEAGADAHRAPPSRRKCPVRPPLLASRRRSVITAPRSMALTMS